MVWKRLQEDTALAEQLKAEELARLQLDKHYRQADRKASRALEQAPHSHTRLLRGWQLLDLAEQQFRRKNTRQTTPFLLKANDALDEFYTLQKLQYACEMLNRQRLIGQPFEATLVEPVAVHLSNQDLSGKPLHQLYLYLYRMLQAPGQHQETFSEYVALFTEWSTQLSPEIARPLLYYAINYCIGRNRSISTKVKTPYANFLQLLWALLRYLPESYPKLRARIEGTTPLNNRDWLLAKLEG